jgi:hypothetical protein
MHASVIEITFKAGSQDEATALTEKLVDQLNERVAGLRGFLVIDRGDNKATAVAMYESKENWEAAAPVAQEILGQLAPFMAGMPERAGCEVLYAKRFVTD